ncbi:MAG: FAD-dependent oxidoreductase [Desulfobacterota bacterium]|nr:FAD-dependent oxidoreductase [Thermodesulfobacteriota bacterium]MDW8002355.1 FAD-dependent oxidoreductase [Deltaproteobacteria bacterium]
MHVKYPHLFSPGKIGNLVTKNRIKYAATETNFPYADGYVSEREIAYMEAQAKGGAGIVTTQGAYPDEKGEGKGFKGMLAIYHDKFIPGLSRLAEVIKKNGALACLQIMHCGREGGVDLDYCLMPSYVPQRLSYFKEPKVMTKEDIKRTIDDHIKAARRAVKAGFDMIEISGIVGYLISTFISKYTNKREDEYGGDIRQRCRLMVEIIQGIKAEVGEKVPCGIRLCGLELLDDRGGNTFEESLETFKIAEEAGADYLSVTVGWHESSIPVITRDVPMGKWLYVAEEVKKRVKIPVMMAFRQFLPQIPERAIAEGKIDFWEVCRPMIADPNLPNKAKELREDEIIPCIACNLCFVRLYYHEPIMCTVRPSLGHEREPEWGYYGFERTKKKKRVLVIGGGPSGLQFADVAAKRGHDVTIFEKREKVGGSLLFAAKVAEGEEELLRVVDYLHRQCVKSGVKILTGKEFSKKTEVDNFDVIVYSGGARFKMLETRDIEVLTPEDIFEKGAKPQGKVIILGGRGLGLALAIYLLRQNLHDLTIIESDDRLGRDVNPFYLWKMVRFLKEKKVRVLLGAKSYSFKRGGLLVAQNAQEVEVEGATVINTVREGALGLFEELKRDFEAKGIEFYLIGDAKRPRRLHNAIHDGYRLGMRI